MPPTAASEQRGADPLPRQTAAVIGAFDGLHLGHQALLAHARALAPHVALVTFDPHPARVLAPDRAPRLLQTPAQRLRVAGALGVDHVVLLPFDAQTARSSPEAFVRDTLRAGLQPAAVVVGADFRFGHERAGSPALLAELLEGTPLRVVDPVALPGAAPGDGSPPDKVGSTAVRKAVLAGEMEDAAAMLGRHYAVGGTVVTGDKRGRTIGFPTANVRVDNEILPPAGVYATVATVWSRAHEGFGVRWASVTNLGTSPTFKTDDAPLRLETHVLDRDLGESLYGAELEVAFVARLRPEARFDGVDALVAQIARDADDARARLDDAALAGAAVNTIQPAGPR